MKELLTSDIYQIRSSYMLDDISYKTLLQLYQPIMGMEAVSLYMTLYSEPVSYTHLTLPTTSRV